MFSDQLITALNERFGMGETVRFDLGRGRLPRIVVKTGSAEAQVYLLGAHVVHFQPVGRQPVLFMSGKSQFENGRPIRGGVPICFPWFGQRRMDSALPMHRFTALPAPRFGTSRPSRAAATAMCGWHCG